MSSAPFRTILFVAALPTLVAGGLPPASATLPSGATTSVLNSVRSVALARAAHGVLARLGKSDPAYTGVELRGSVLTVYRVPARAKTSRSQVTTIGALQVKRRSSLQHRQLLTSR